MNDWIAESRFWGQIDLDSNPGLNHLFTGDLKQVT